MSDTKESQLPISGAPIGGRTFSPSPRSYKASEPLPESLIDTLNGAELRSIAATRGYDMRQGGTGMSREHFKRLQREDSNFEGTDFDSYEREEEPAADKTATEGLVPTAYGAQQNVVGSIPDDRERDSAPFGDGTKNSHDQVPDATVADEITGDASADRPDLETTTDEKDEE